MTAKDTVRALLDRLPDDCSLEDVQYHLCVVQAVARGEADEEAGRASHLRARYVHDADALQTWFATDGACPQNEALRVSAKSFGRCANVPGTRGKESRHD